MDTRVKRTYKLSSETVSAVRELSAEYGVAATQDGVVEIAVRELARTVREAREADLWEQAANDPAFLAERDALEREFDPADAETWPP